MPRRVRYDFWFDRLTEAEQSLEQVAEPAALADL